MTVETNDNKEIPYHKTESYKADLASFISASHQNFKKDTTTALKQQKMKTYQQPMLSFSVTDIQGWLKNPAVNEVRLRDMSRFLYNANPLYKWVITTLSGMPTWSWALSIDTYGARKSPDKIQKIYRQGLSYINNKNIPSELAKAFLIAIKEDFFYGYEIETNDYYFILQLDPNFCRVSRQVGDGIYGIQFDFSFFESKENIEGTGGIIDSYPLEFQEKFQGYKRDGVKWRDLDVNNTITFKMNDDIPHAIPYYANLFPSLADLGFYKELAKERAEIDNFLLLHQKIPVDEKEFNKFAIDLNLAKSFNNIANDSLPDGVKMLTSPMDVTAVKTERSNKDNQSAKDALEQVYNDAGMPQQLSNSANNTTAGLAKGIIVNEQIVFRFYRQAEKIYNYKLKNKFVGNKFKFKLLDITNFNKEEKIKTLLTNAQNGLTPPSHVASASGTNPYEFFNDVDLESNILGITHKLQPLLTSHTISGKDVHPHEGGAPTKSEDNLTDAGQASRDNDVNV